jgi:hypothetical protein
MLDHRNSYRRTAAAALLACALALVAGTALMIWPGAVFSPRPTAVILSLAGFAVAALAGLVAAGGLVGLRRDALEMRGEPYYTDQPRECPAGAFARLRRRLLALLPGSTTRLRLWPGEWVEIRSLAEIAATLDDEGRLDGLPFMPEMVRHCGQRYRVFRRIEKIHYYFGPVVPHLRRLRDAVLLQELRCDGGGHGGCQAGCQFVWKEAWLAPRDHAHTGVVTKAASGSSRLDEFTQVRSPDGEVRYVCQMTELPGATTRLSWNDPRHYWRDFRSGNIRLTPFLTAVALALFNVVQRKTGGPVAPYRAPTDRKSSPKEMLDLQPGEIVRVKMRAEIEKTLNSASKNRGLWFDREMHRFCGGEFRVASRVRTIVDEASGKMLSMNNPCIVLEGVAATGEYLGLCPQNELIYWREAWLERVAATPVTAARALDSPSVVVSG